MESVFGESVAELLGCEWQEVVDEAEQDLSEGAEDDVDMTDIKMTAAVMSRMRRLQLLFQ